MSETGANGNGHGHSRLDDLEDEIGALNEDLGQQGLALQNLLGLQERFQEQVVKDVSGAVASLLEERLAPIERGLSDVKIALTELRGAVGDLAAMVTVALRRP